MFNLTNLTVAPNQTANAVLADGSIVTLTFIYRPAVQRWTVDVSYPKGNFLFKGMGLSTFPNLLRTWRYVIPFGLQVSTVDGTDPFMASDLAPQGNGIPARVTVTILENTTGITDVFDVDAADFAAVPV
jgi:hypothetical protein